MAHSSVLIYSIFVLYLSSVFYKAETLECNRRHETVSELEHIFIGRCVDFQTNIHPEKFCTSGLKNCSDLWSKFKAAFSDSPVCNVTAEQYKDFMLAAHHPIVGKQLFYSGLGSFARRYSNQGRRFTIQDDTLPGYVVTGLSFCGGDAGYDATMPCPRWNPDTCPHTASGDFWVAASRNFASNAVGNVYVLMNATRNPVYKSTSYFTKYEVPELLPGVVRKVTALLINDSPYTKIDPCVTDESVEILRTTLKEKNIEFDCEENPKDLLYFYCVDNVEREVCKSNGPYIVDQGNKSCGDISLLVVAMLLYVLLKD